MIDRLDEMPKIRKDAEKIRELRAELAAAKRDLQVALINMENAMEAEGEKATELAAARAEIERLGKATRGFMQEVERLSRRCEEARKVIESLKGLDYQTAGTPNYVLEEWLEGKP